MLSRSPPPGGRRWRVVLVALGLSALAQAVAQAPMTKIRFDLTDLDAAGLYGPPDGLRALSYEFCIPDRPDSLAEVRAIDASVRAQRSPGRIGCVHGELLCIGNTHQPEYRVVLEALARLPYVARIEQAYFE